MIKPPWIWLMYLTLQVNFQITLGLMKSNVCVPLLNILRNLRQWVDIKCKKCNVQNLWKCIFRASRRVSFSYIPKVALDHGLCPLLSWYPLKFCESCYNTQFKSYATSKMELSVIKIGNSWKHLFISVTENFVLNVSGFLDPTLKQIDKFRWWRKIIPSDIYMFKLNNNKKTLETCQIY